MQLVCVLLLQEEREAADAKLMKLKLQAKAKVASLNKRIEELTEKGSALPAQTLSEEQVCPTAGRTASSELLASTDNVVPPCALSPSALAGPLSC